MAKRYVVAPGHEFNYPNELDDRIIKASGGRSKLSESEKARIKFKTATEGMDCSDMPKEAFNLYLERGWILELDDTKVEPVKEVANEEEV
jgi:hypothetical protein